MQVEQKEHINFEPLQWGAGGALFYMYTERLIAVFLVPRTVPTHSISALCARTLRTMSSHEVTQGTSSSFCTSNLHRRLGIEERPECKKAIKTKASGNLLHLKYCGNTSRQSSHTADIGSESAHRNWFLTYFRLVFFWEVSSKWTEPVYICFSVQTQPKSHMKQGAREKRRRNCGEGPVTARLLRTKK